MGRAAGTRKLVALLALLLLSLACISDDQPLTGLSPSHTPTPAASPPPTTSLTPPLTDALQTIAIPVPPERDLFDLALRFGRIQPETPRLAHEFPVTHKEGDLQEFTVLDISAPATLTN